MLQLVVKDGARSWVKVPLSGEGGSGKGGGFRCPSSQGIAAQLAQVSLLSWPASFCLHPLGCVEPNTFGCCTTCLPACPTALPPMLPQYAGEGRHLALCDFEEHLDDISLDWLNPGLLQGPA